MQMEAEAFGQAKDTKHRGHVQLSFESKLQCSLQDFSGNNFRKDFCELCEIFKMFLIDMSQMMHYHCINRFTSLLARVMCKAKSSANSFSAGHKWSSVGVQQWQLLFWIQLLHQSAPPSDPHILPCLSQAGRAWSPKPPPLGEPTTLLGQLNSPGTPSAQFTSAQTLPPLLNVW